MTWRIIQTETHSAAMNMALDEAAMEAIAQKKAPPTIRFYRWNPSAVSIGYFQSLKDEIDEQECLNQGVDIVRRQTGGGAVYHDFDGEVTYSVIAPETNFPKDITRSYHITCGWIVDALEHLGISAQFKPINDIITKGKKISGNAQTRRKGIFLQHGTILYDLDVKKMFSLLKVGIDKISDKFIKAVEERVTSVQHLNKNISRKEVESALFKAFCDGKSYEIGTWTEEELARAKELTKEKYGNKTWSELR